MYSSAIMKISVAGVFVALLLIGCTGCCGAQNKDPAFQKDRTLTRTEVDGIVGQARKITTPNGVESLLPLQINGATQWLSVR